MVLTEMGVAIMVRVVTKYNSNMDDDDNGGTENGNDGDDGDNAGRDNSGGDSADGDGKSSLSLPHLVLRVNGSYYLAIWRS